VLSDMTFIIYRFLRLVRTLISRNYTSLICNRHVRRRFNYPTPWITLNPTS